MLEEMLSKADRNSVTVCLHLPPQLLCCLKELLFCCGLVTKSCPILCDPWTVAHQAPLSTGFPRQGHWSGFPFPSSGDVPNSGIEPESPVSKTQFYKC